MMVIFILIITLQAVSMGMGRDLAIDISDIRTKEMIANIDEMKVAIMGMAEYIQEINTNVNQVKEKMNQTPWPIKAGRMDSNPYRGLSVDEILKREELAQKIEHLFSSDNATKLETVKQDIVTVVETNFIKMLAAVLLTAPVQAQERTPQILRLMRNVLNQQVDFKPIVDRLPFLIRSSDTNQFIILLKALRDKERSERQFGGLEDLGKVIDAMGKLDMKQVSGFLKEIPELFESIEAVIDGVDEYF